MPYKSALISFFVALLLYTGRACEEGEASESTARQDYFPGFFNYDSVVVPWSSAYYFKKPLPSLGTLFKRYLKESFLRSNELKLPNFVHRRLQGHLRTTHDHR